MTDHLQHECEAFWDNLPDDCSKEEFVALLEDFVQRERRPSHDHPQLSIFKPVYLPNRTRE